MQAGIVKWWPVPLIAVYVAVIRFGGVRATVAWWLWAPIAAAIVILLVVHRSGVTLSPETLLFSSYIAFTALSLLWSPDPARGLRFLALVGTSFLAFVYGRAFHAPDADSRLTFVAAVGLAVAVAGLLLWPDPPDFEGLNPDRILGMGAVALVVMSWYGRPGRVWTVGVGLLGAFTVFLSTSRTTMLVMVVLLITAPGLRLSRWARLALAAGLVVLAFLISLTPAFQQRWFEAGSGSLFDVVTIQGLETSGRGEVWPVVADACSSPIAGDGAGAADSYAFAEHSGFPEPHNEYLRVWCDTGIIGSTLLWGFVIVAMARAISWARRTPDRWPHHTLLQLGLALLILSLTDNPLTTAVPFMIPICLAFGWSSTWKDA